MKYLNQGQYFGNSVNTRNIHGFILTEKQHSSGDTLPKHIHNNAYISNVLGGYWEEEFENKIRNCKPLQTIVHPPGEKHSDKFTSNSHLFNIEIPENFCSEKNTVETILTDPAEFYNEEINWLTFKIFYEFKNFDSSSPLIIESSILELLQLISHKTKFLDEIKKPIWLNVVKDLITEKFNRQITLSEIAKEIGIHSVHLSRSFRKFNNCTLGDYQRRLKINEACKRIALNNSSLTEITYDMGFYDQAHFNRVFKKYTGLSPLQYRSCLLN